MIPFIYVFSIAAAASSAALPNLGRQLELVASVSTATATVSDFQIPS
jgi:hypothetical protein